MEYLGNPLHNKLVRLNDFLSSRSNSDVNYKIVETVLRMLDRGWRLQWSPSCTLLTNFSTILYLSRIFQSNCPFFLTRILIKSNPHPNNLEALGNAALWKPKDDKSDEPIGMLGLPARRKKTVWLLCVVKASSDSVFQGVNNLLSNAPGRLVTEQRQLVSRFRSELFD